MRIRLGSVTISLHKRLKDYEVCIREDDSIMTLNLTKEELLNLAFTILAFLIKKGD